jgi:RNA polymerase primary sigma factor
MGMRQLKITKSITNRESQSFEKYLQEIGKMEMVSPEEEARLARRIREGDQLAIGTLTKANLRFVVSVAKQYQFHGLSLPDLINEGNLGLIKAAQRFDETKGFKFISYAVWWIRQGIMQALTEQARLVRLPANRIGLSNRVQKAFSQLEQEHERAPSADELATFLDMTSDEVLSVHDFDFHYTSLDAPISEGNEGTLGDQMKDENSGADKDVDYSQSLHLEVMRCLESLNERQKEVLCYFFGIGIPHPLSLQEIGLKYDLTMERVRQIKDKAIVQLRSPKKANLLKVYLGN